MTSSQILRFVSVIEYMNTPLDGVDSNDRALEDNNVLVEGSQSAQCFLYDDCNRQVLPATEDCPLTR